MYGAIQFFLKKLNKYFANYVDNTISVDTFGGKFRTEARTIQFNKVFEHDCLEKIDGRNRRKMLSEFMKKNITYL